MIIEEITIPLILMLIIFLITKTHVINRLIIIEYLSLIVIVSITLFIKLINLENYNILYFMILLITESVIGLSILISIIRTHGNDFIKSSTVLKL